MKRQTNRDILDDARLQPARGSFGTGAPACANGECDLDTPESYGLDYLDCYFDMDAQSVTAAGQTAFTLLFDPNAMPWIQPVAVSATVVDSTDPQLDQRAWFTAVGVHGCFQENINETTPTAATTRMWPSDKWDPRSRNGCACPVCWDLYSNAANTRQLSITGFNPNPAGTTERILVVTYGKACGGIPDNCRPARIGNNQRNPKRIPVPGSGLLRATGAGGGPRGSAIPL